MNATTRDVPTRSLQQQSHWPEQLRRAHLVVLLNCIVPQQKHVFHRLAQRVGRLTILVSTSMEPNRKFDTNWGDLDVQVQSNWMLTRKWRHRGAFTEDNYIHIPWRTIVELKWLKPDLVATYEMGVRTLLTSLYCRGRVPWVLVGNMSEHSESNRGQVRRWLRRYLTRRAAVATYNGPSCRRYMQSLGFSDDRLCFFPYSADPNKIYQGAILEKSGPYRILFGGALTERKNIWGLVTALTEWSSHHPDREVELNVAGSGPLMAPLQSLTLPPNLKIHWLGQLDAAGLREHYAQTDLYAYPSFADEWGLGVEEALGSGVPVIASSLAQSTEALVRDGRNGWVFNPERPNDLYAALDRALSTDRVVMRTMAARARESTVDYSPDIAADKLCEAVGRAWQLHHGHQDRKR